MTERHGLECRCSSCEADHDSKLITCAANSGRMGERCIAAAWLRSRGRDDLAAALEHEVHIEWAKEQP